MTEVTIKGINGVGKFVIPQPGKIKTRGWKQGAKACPTECSICRDEISVGEQYIRANDGYLYCLGCAQY